MGFVYMTNPALGGASQEVSDLDGVVERQEALGWVRADRPAPEAFRPPSGDQAESPSEWIELWHPALDREHAFANNPAAIAGAAESGWIIRPAPAAPTGDTSTPEPAALADPVGEPEEPAAEAPAEKEEV
jgi:hypothetical protein